VLPFTLLVVFVSSNSGDKNLLLSLRCTDHHPIRIGGERERLAAASPLVTKSRGPSWGRSNYRENGLVKTPRRGTRALSPAGMLRGAAPLGGTEEQTARAIGAYVQYASLLTFQMMSIN
jgi:hypothetical protein